MQNDKWFEPLLELSDNQLDESMKVLIRKWSTPPTSLELLEVIDKIIFASLASSFVLSFLQIMYDSTLKNEGKSHNDIVTHASWRNNLL